MQTRVDRVIRPMRLSIVCLLLLVSAFSTSAVLPAGPETPEGTIVPPRWVTPDWAERHLYALRSPVMKDSHTDHVISLYFFGEYKDRTLIGLERVKGDDYRQYFSLLVFDKRKLLGYYENIASFPSKVGKDGVVLFPDKYQPRAFGDGQFFSIANDNFKPLCLGQATICVRWQPGKSG